MIEHIYQRKVWKRNRHNGLLSVVGFWQRTKPFGSHYWKTAPAGKADGKDVFTQNIRKEWHTIQRRAVRWPGGF